MLRSINTVIRQKIFVKLYSIKKYDLNMNDTIGKKHDNKNLLMSVRKFNFSTGTKTTIEIYTSRKKYICILNNTVCNNFCVIIVILIIILELLLILYIII